MNETSLGEALGEMREALYLLKQVPAGSFVGPPGFESQPVEEAIAEMEQQIREQEKLIQIHGANHIPQRPTFAEYWDDPEHDSLPGALNGWGG